MEPNGTLCFHPLLGFVEERPFRPAFATNQEGALAPVGTHFAPPTTLE